MENKIKLLVIDDDQIDRMLLLRSLKTSGLGYELTELEDPSRVFETLSNQSFDCIFLDYLLPGDDGLSLLKKIRDYGVKTPVVITTSQGSESIAVELMKAGASDYVVKNQISGHSIGQVLRNILRLSKIEREREAAIREKEVSEARLAVAQRIAKIGNWELDSFNGTMYWSDEVYNILELKPGEIVPTIDRAMTFAHPEDKALVIQTVSEALQGKQFNIDFRIITSAGTKYTNAQGYAVLEKDQPVRLIGTVQDITERKLAEQEILKARELAEHSMRVRESFLANMSHEIRTPMNAILGFTRLLYDTDLTNDQKSFLDAIHFSGENLLVIINDILDLSKLQSGKMTFEKLEFNLNDLVKGVTSIFKQKAAEKGLQLTYQIKQHVPHIIKGDPVRLNQVLTNLIGNAIKFTERGYVHLDIQSNMANDDRYSIDFKVIDTGIGISEDKQAVVFESFVQASNDTTRKYGGTGLGLTIVKSIVELQEGKISLASTPGQGSTFTVNLKFDKGERTTLTKEHNFIPEESTELLRDASILVVEDNAVNQLLVKKVLHKFGCKTDVAINGLKAIESLKTGKYDVILMDIQMPEMDGYEATRYIRANFPPPLCNIPIIAMTAHAFHAEIEKSAAVGMNDHISKPFKQEVLFATISKYLRKKEETKVIPLHRQDSSKYMIDLNPLYELSKSDEEFVSEIIRVYDKQTQKFTERLRDAVRSQDFDTIKSICHQIKGSYGMLRMNELKKSLEEIAQIFREEDCRAQFAKVNFLVSNIIALISAANEEVKRKLRQTA
jgi:signal transduction histidine kinase/PleD family two-component response regulator/HPt (histidine-containing phosphotransfer) domain-containing protein